MTCPRTSGLNMNIVFIQHFTCRKLSTVDLGIRDRRGPRDHWDSKWWGRSPGTIPALAKVSLPTEIGLTPNLLASSPVYFPLLSQICLVNIYLNLDLVSFRGKKSHRGFTCSACISDSFLNHFLFTGPLGANLITRFVTYGLRHLHHGINCICQNGRTI